MQNILDEIRSDLKSAMKEKNIIVRDTIRVILKHCKDTEIANKSELTNDDVIKIIDKIKKQCDESIVDFKSAKRQDLIDQELLRVKILNTYLPKAPTEAELQEIIDKVLLEDTSNGNIGKLMSEIKNKLPSRSDLRYVNTYLRQKLAE